MRKRHVWTEEELKELEDPETWDDSTEVHPAVKNPRVIVSVSFLGPEIGLVDGQARRDGKKLTDFIREAALEKASLERGISPGAVTISAGTSGCLTANCTAAAPAQVELAPR